MIKVNDYITLAEISKEEYKILYDLVIKNKLHLSQWLQWVEYVEKPEDYIETIEEWQQGNRNTTMLVLGIYYQQKLIGITGFVGIDRLNKHGEIGYWLSKEYTEKGIMTLSVEKVTDFGFEALGLHRIIIKMDPNNEKSKNIPLRLGYTQESVLKECLLLKGEFYDALLYRMLEYEWKKLHS